MNKFTVTRVLGLLLVLSIAVWGLRQQVVSARMQDARPLKLQATARPTLLPTETQTPLPTETSLPTETPTATIRPTNSPPQPAAPTATPTAPADLMLPETGGG